MTSSGGSTRARWMLVGWLTIFLIGTDLFVVAPFLPVIARELKADPASLTWMVSIFSIVYAIACPLLGSLAERVGLPRVLLGGLTLLAAGNLATAHSADFVSLLFSRALAGLGAAATSPMLYALAAELAGPERRASDLATINSGLLVALVMGAPVGLVVGTWSGWREVFDGLALAFALMLPLNYVTWRRAGITPHRRRPRPLAATPPEQLTAAVPYLLAMVFWSSSVYAVYTLLGTALETDYQLSVSATAQTLAAYGAGAAIGSVVGGRIADRIGAERMTTLCFVAMLCTCGLMLLIYHMHQPRILAGALFAFSLSAYGFFPALQACASRRFTTRRPTVLGLISSSLYIGLTLGSAGAGRLYQSAGMTSVIASSLVPSVLGILTARRIKSQLSANLSVKGSGAPT